MLYPDTRMFVRLIYLTLIILDTVIVSSLLGPTVIPYYL